MAVTYNSVINVDPNQPRAMSLGQLADVLGDVAATEETTLNKYESGKEASLIGTKQGNGTFELVSQVLNKDTKPFSQQDVKTLKSALAEQASFKHLKIEVRNSASVADELSQSGPAPQRTPGKFGLFNAAPAKKDAGNTPAPRGPRGMG